MDTKTKTLLILAGTAIAGVYVYTRYAGPSTADMIRAYETSGGEKGVQGGQEGVFVTIGGKRQFLPWRSVEKAGGALARGAGAIWSAFFPEKEPPKATTEAAEKARETGGDVAYQDFWASLSGAPLGYAAQTRDWMPQWTSSYGLSQPWVPFPPMGLGHQVRSAAGRGRFIPLRTPAVPPSGMVGTLGTVE